MLHCSSTTHGAWCSATAIGPPCPPPLGWSGKSTLFCAVKCPPSCVLPISLILRSPPRPTLPRCWPRCVPGKTFLHDCPASSSHQQPAVAGGLRHHHLWGRRRPLAALGYPSQAPEHRAPHLGVRGLVGAPTRPVGAHPQWLCHARLGGRARHRPRAVVQQPPRLHPAHDRALQKVPV